MDPTAEHLTNIHRFWLNKNFKATVVQGAEKSCSGSRSSERNYPSQGMHWLVPMGNILIASNAVQNNPQMGLICTSLILHKYQMSKSLNVSQLTSDGPITQNLDSTLFT